MTRCNGTAKQETPPASELPAELAGSPEQLNAYLRHHAEWMSVILSTLDRVMRVSNIAAAAAVAKPDELPKLREKLRKLVETDSAQLVAKRGSKFGDMTIADCLQRLEAQKRGRR